MNAELLLINKEFGLKQLSDNEALYKKLLLRFLQEYRESAQKVAEFQTQNNQDAMQLLVHTIKGVSGNLGLDYLHSIAKVTDDDVKSQGASAELSSLQSALSQTLAQIEEYCDASAANAGNTNQALDEFKQALSAHRFISPEQLDDFLEAAQIPAHKHAAMHEAIADLDYTTAQTLLGD